MIDEKIVECTFSRLNRGKREHQKRQATIRINTKEDRTVNTITEYI